MNKTFRASIFFIIIAVLCLLIFLIGRLMRDVVKTRHFTPVTPDSTVTAPTGSPLAPIPSSPLVAAAGKMTMSVIDVGQGDSILVQFPNGQTMLVDAGPGDHGTAVVNYLHAQGVANIDLLVATHPHEDHIGGMIDVLNVVSIGTVWDSGFNHGSPVQRKYLAQLLSKNISYEKVTAGEAMQFGAARAVVLAPLRLTENVNDNSLVIRLTYGSISYLLTGDMEQAERESVGRWPASTVLKVAHHGSRNGTDDNFARAVHPQYAVISCALINDYGHPHPEAISALEKIGAEIHRTSTEGTVVVETDGNTVSVTSSGVASNRVELPPSNANVTSMSYIGNKNSKVFHLLSCSSLPAMQNRVIFKTRDETMQGGYRPCPRCQP